MFVQTSDGITTIAMEHSLAIECGDALHRTVLDLLDDGRRALIVDLVGVSRLDAAGIGQLVRAFTAVRERGGALKVVVRCDQIRELLDRTKLTTIVPTFSSVDLALASFPASSLA